MRIQDIPHERDTERFPRVLHYKLGTKERMEVRYELSGTHTGQEAR